VEADEFDRSFCICTQILLASSMDADHLDIYGTSDAIKESFVEFANKVKIK
jgi:UDP-N-acetylmuramate--alanine ligase